MKGVEHMISITTNNRVREIRARYKTTQEELADFLNIAPATFRKKENGSQEWRMSEMFLIIYYFNTYKNDNLKLEDVFLCKIN